MKKALFVLMALLIASPAMAVTLTATADNAAKTVTIGWAGNGTDAATRARAFGLVITSSNGPITAVNGFATGEGAKYGIFPGTIVIANGAVTDYNKPVEPATLPGAAGTGIGTNSIVVAMGSLYVGDANAPGAAGNLITVTVGGLTAGQSSTITVTEERQYRGGVVMEDASVLATPLTASATITVAAAVCVGDVDGNKVINKADVVALVNYIGANAVAPLWKVTNTNANWKPAGDVDGNGVINKADIVALVNYIGAHATAPLWRVTCP